VDLQLRLEAGLPAVRADRGQMEQVLVNLATNARDAMPDGGVLEIATSARAIDSVAPETGGLPPGEYVSVVVKDTGTGISPDILGRIFEPFFSTKVAGTGMGLGLAMVHGIVLDSGGRVLVDSEVGLGSSFTILLPRTVSAVAAAAVPGDGPERIGQRLTVLLVDDEQNVRAVARRILERDGCRVIEAAGGAEALAVVENSSVELDLLVTDLVMPGIHGRYVIARCETLRPSLPIVCMTGYAGQGEDPRDYGKNLVALLSKPFSSDALKRAVRSAAARRGPS
jgi:two-component system, cell cycle sensor histidine kinase and response regulator CckA